MSNQQKENQPTKQKQAKDLGTYIVIGFMLGALVGIVTGNLTLWMGTGMCLGIVVGAIAGIRTQQGQE